jgi:subtilisin family serine protease
MTIFGSYLKLKLKNMKHWFILSLFLVFSYGFSQKQLIASFPGSKEKLLEKVHETGFTVTKTISLSESKLNQLKNDALRTVNSTESIDRIASFYTFSNFNDSLIQWLKTNDISYFFSDNEPVPPPSDLPPTTPSYFAQQNYLQANPGLNVEAVWALGFNGQNTTIHNIEYGFNKNHEEFHVFNCDIAPNMDINSSATTDFTEHGTATMGVLFGNNGAYGVTGIAHGAQQVWLYPEWQQIGYNRVNAINQALNNSVIGDIIVYEMQAFGFNGNSSNPKYVPAEYNTLVWNVTKALTDAGRIVVAAAGNGNQNLDDFEYQSYMNLGDSGAIIIGAGTSNTTHSRLSFSTYGSRVDVQAWGQNVRTSGAITGASVTQVGGDFNQSYMTFSGTSSATALVGGIAAIAQSIYRANNTDFLTSQQLRTILIDTGIPQGGDTSTPIGPMPNLVNVYNYIQQNLSTTTLEGNNNIVIYPNPSQGKFTISNPNNTITAIEVFDVLGKKIEKLQLTSQGNTATFDLSAYANGVYIVKITTSKDNIVKRVVKQ